MSSRSNPQDWYRREEKATERARRRMSRARKSHVNPVYVAAAAIAVLVIVLLIMAFGPAYSL